MPIQIIDRKNRIEMKLRGHFIFVDSFHILGEDTTSIKENSEPINILQSIKTDNGYVYIINKSLVPYNFEV